MMQNLKYTVLMSVYYKEKPEYLSLSIESMLNQTVKPDEFIIVKDGPLTTELDEVINNFVTAYPKMFNIIVNETNLGLGPALAKGIENSKNELIARMDSDDYVVSTRCEKQLEKFREDPKLGMVGSYEAEFVDTVDNVISIHRVPSENDEIERFMHRRCSVLHPTVMYKKSAVWDFSMVVIDELSSFKNYQSQRFKFLRKVRPFVKRWVGLTGTPSSNGLMDLWAEIGILDGGERLGKFIGRYREAYFKAGSMNPATGIVFQYIPRQGAEEMIYQRISDITISMKALDYLNMPDCVPTRYEVEMNTEERKIYDMLRQDLLIPLKDGDIDAANAGALTGKLLQMSNGAVYDENGKARVIHDHKLEALEDLIEAANGQPVLVAYWFKHDRERIINHLSKLKIKVRDIKSSTDIKDWNAGNIPVALIHPASAGHGLNIQQGGHILIWFGLTWSLELYQQTNARLWRQGQTHVVTIHHIITKNTVDEDVVTALEQKDMTQEKLISAVKAQLGV